MFYLTIKKYEFTYELLEYLLEMILYEIFIKNLDRVSHVVYKKN